MHVLPQKDRNFLGALEYRHDFLGALNYHRDILGTLKSRHDFLVSLKCRHDFLGCFCLTTTPKLQLLRLL